MVQGGQHPRLALETSQPVWILCKGRRQNLDGNFTIESSVACPVDFSHSAYTEERVDSVSTDFLAHNRLGTALCDRHGSHLQSRDFDQATCALVVRQQRFNLLKQAF